MTKKKIYYDDYHNNYYLYARGILGYFSCIFWYNGMVMLPLGDAVSITMMMPFMVIMMSPVIGEKITFNKLKKALVGFAGLLFIVKPPFLMSLFGIGSPTDEGGSRTLGIIVNLLAAFVYAVEGLVCRGGKDVDNMALTHYVFFVCLLIFPWNDNFQEFISINDTERWRWTDFLLAVIVGFVGCTAQFCYTRAF